MYANRDAGVAVPRFETERRSQHGQGGNTRAGGHDDLRSQDAEYLRPVQHHFPGRLEGSGLKAP